jgi:hypothetical protein
LAIFGREDLDVTNVLFSNSARRRMMSLLDIEKFWPAAAGEQRPAGKKLIANLFTGLGTAEALLFRHFLSV